MIFVFLASIFRLNSSAPGALHPPSDDLGFEHKSLASYIEFKYIRGLRRRKNNAAVALGKMGRAAEADHYFEKAKFILDGGGEGGGGGGFREL